MLSAEKTDVLVIGSGAAGLALALSVADQRQVILISKTVLKSGASRSAQGGIAAVLSRQKEDLASHVQDTLSAGAGLCQEAVVRMVISQGREAILWLIDRGVQFSLDAHTKTYHLNMEGGHSHRRIYHVADKTGDAVVSTLDEQVLAHPNITCFLDHTAIELIVSDGVCLGAYILDNQSREIKCFLSDDTVLATGGASYVYQQTTSPDYSTGDGIVMAYQAGCRIANMEFTQFHPTALYAPNEAPFLVSEMVRGEGGLLRLPTGESFMSRYDARAELAPRDIVSRAIDAEMKQHNLTHVLLDITHKPVSDIKRLFPNIVAHCERLNIDMTRTPIPVLPAAHYTCGGVVTDQDGATCVSHLYAIGEVASTGLHGANRMASNSLLECLVFAMRSAKAILSDLRVNKHSGECPQLSACFSSVEDPLTVDVLTQSLRALMTQHMGIIRQRAALLDAKQQVVDLALKATACSSLSPAWLTLDKLVKCASLMLDSALLRHESRGAHYIADYPGMAAQAVDSVLEAIIDRQV